MQKINRKMSKIRFKNGNEPHGGRGGTARGENRAAAVCAHCCAYGCGPAPAAQDLPCRPVRRG